MPATRKPRERSETISLPLVFTHAEFRANTIDSDSRTVDLAFYSGAIVLHAPLFDEPRELEFEISKKAADLSRLNKGAPLMDSHRTHEGLEAQLGVVEKAWLEDREARATVRFSKRADVEPVWQDVQDRIVRNVSMGVSLKKLEEITEQGADLKRFRVTSWQPYELSLVPVNADPDAQALLGLSGDTEKHPCHITFRAEALANAHEGETMEIKVRLLADCELGKSGEIVEIDEKEFDEKLHSKELEPKKPKRDKSTDADVVTAARVVDEAIAADEKLATEVRRVTEHFNLETTWADRHIQLQTPIEQVVKLAAAERAKLAPIVSGQVSGVDDPDSKATRLALMTDALSARVMREEVPAPARQYAHKTLLELAYECLAFRGLHRGLDPRGNSARVLELALTSSDFPYLLANAANKILLADYEHAEPTYRLMAERQDLPDFKTASVLKAGDFPLPLEVGEDGEVKLGKFSEAKDTYALATYGRRLLFSFTAIVNDDLGAFNRIMRSAAIRLADFENGLWFALLTSASGLGPTLGDSVALFNAASHGNYTSSGTAIAIASIGVGRALMKKQESVDGVKLNVIPRYILTSPEKETLARQYTTVLGTNVVAAEQNPWAGMLEPISDANLTTANPWYLAADPARAPVSVYGYLSGATGPQVATRQGFEVLGVEMRVALHFGVAFIDYRGIYRNAGA